MGRTITPEQAAVIKATVPVLAAHGLTITTRFYKDLIGAHPDLRNIFNKTHQATGHQPRALAGALYAYAANIDNLGALSPAVELICAKHASLFIQPEHYELVGVNLLKTIKAVLGDAATDAIMDAWGAAYWQLADIMIDREQELYDSATNWTDWKDFKITRKEKESAEITSFYLEPLDQSFKLPTYKPGQFISVNVFVEELDGGVWQARQYSLSDAPGTNYLRISVKKEAGVLIGEPASMTHPGYISNILHEQRKVGDVVRLSHPFGDFFMDDKEEEKDAPVVLISAGVGLTALISILKSLAKEESKRPITWVHGARDAGVRAFKKETDELVAKNENIHAIRFSTHPNKEEVEGDHYHFKGRADLNKVSTADLHTDNKKTQYFVCGPTKFMLDVESQLQAFGVPSERIKMELFGTGGVQRV
ncbi:globin-like protein [Amniculicola lignicola CBS 123094]|uniref:nitric oxide dioxygenase n=1 Tax=Amniculicola lignicola CBS 123094 TaxID=1392246 RepID=A0A6A5WE01_9PLEO|nr:globin-like protein [Amniculicola lignicola CBS 123094]